MPMHPELADSAGQPWAGRKFEESDFDGDDGSADPALIAALERFKRGAAATGDVIDALRDVRLLIPLVAHAGETGVNEHGVTIDKTQELAIVTVAGPDGRTVLPVFSSVAAMSSWRPEARPVPATAVRVALAAASEQTDLVVLDPGSETEFVIRRPALWAIAQSLPWIPCHADPTVLAAFQEAARPEPTVLSVTLVDSDPDARLTGPELLVRLELVGGLSRVELDAVMARLQERWATSTIIADRVDSLKVQLVAQV